MHGEGISYAYGFWSLVVINVALFAFFILGAKSGMVTQGPYAYVRHPQYSGLFLVMIGMLIQWPTIITALMFAVLTYVYYRLSKREEREMIEVSGDDYKRYMEKTPMFVPRLAGKIS